MNLTKSALLLYFSLGAIAIAATIVGESYKIVWVLNWVAPILLLLCFVSLTTLSHKPDPTVSTPVGKIARYAKPAAFAVLIYLFVMIDIVSDTPVTLRLMGMSWTMSAHAASRVLTVGGLVIGAIGVWMTQAEARRKAAAAALAESRRGKTPSVPPPRPRRPGPRRPRPRSPTGPRIRALRPRRSTPACCRPSR